MMPSFAHRTDLLPPSSFLSYWGRIMSACKEVRGGEVGTPSPVLYICSGFSAASLGWSYLSVRSVLPSMSLNVLASLTSRVGRIALSHAACKSVLVGRDNCLEAWCLTAGKEGARCTWSRVFTVGLICRGTMELYKIYETGEAIDQKEVETNSSAGELAQAGIEWSPWMLEGSKYDGSPWETFLTG